ncbi:MAG: DUF3368 domain-containing protein [Candidatus Binatia bacterium]
MIVVSDAGPLIALGKLGQLGLLFKLYDQVFMPREVYHEVVRNGLRLGASDSQAIDFLVQQGHIQVIAASLPSPLPDWTQPIDIGEVEVIVLAQQQEADWALIDDAQARKAARQLGLPLKGTVGILLEAFRKNSLSLQEFELLIYTIKTQPDLWISEHLCNQALTQARKEAQQQSQSS